MPERNDRLQADTLMRIQNAPLQVRPWILQIIHPPSQNSDTGHSSARIARFQHTAQKRFIDSVQTLMDPQSLHELVLGLRITIVDPIDPFPQCGDHLCGIALLKRSTGECPCSVFIGCQLFKQFRDLDVRNLGHLRKRT